MYNKFGIVSSIILSSDETNKEKDEHFLIYLFPPKARRRYAVLIYFGDSGGVFSLLRLHSHHVEFRYK
jgi:hypothetical protein